MLAMNPRDSVSAGRGGLHQPERTQTLVRKRSDHLVVGSCKRPERDDTGGVYGPTARAGQALPESGSRCVFQPRRRRSAATTLLLPRESSLVTSRATVSTSTPIGELGGDVTADATAGADHDDRGAVEAAISRR